MAIKIFNQQKVFSKFAWAYLGYNLLVIMWGAFVRATGSGAGCGSHWPLCDGVVIPRAPEVETLIELTHRLTSGLLVPFFIGLMVGAFRIFPKGSPVRKALYFVGFFTLTEALVGAGLVKFELVGENSSAERAIVMMFHLINTFWLIGAITLTAWWAQIGPPQKIRWPKRVGIYLVIGLAGMMVLGASGAVAALGDTLYPSSSLVEGVRQDFDPTAHFLIRLRIFHPLIAIGLGAYLIVLSHFLRRTYPDSMMQKTTGVLSGLYIGQLVLGVINVLLLAPIAIQLIHLLVTELIWIALLLTTELFFGGRIVLQRASDHLIQNPVNQTAT